MTPHQSTASTVRKRKRALAAFLEKPGARRRCGAVAEFLHHMIAAVQSPSGAGLTWCNDTPHKIMAAIATTTARP